MKLAVVMKQDSIGLRLSRFNFLCKTEKDKFCHNCAPASSVQREQHVTVAGLAPVYKISVSLLSEESTVLPCAARASHLRNSVRSH
jgi:hypothetical protein